MSRRELYERFRGLEARIADEKGPFVLFALAWLGNWPERWDVLVSATWLGDDHLAAIDMIVDQIKAKLGIEALDNVSRIIIAEPASAGVQTLNSTMPVEHGGIEIVDDEFLGLHVRRALIITSKRPAAPATA